MTVIIPLVRKPVSLPLYQDKNIDTYTDTDDTDTDTDIDIDIDTHTNTD